MYYITDTYTLAPSHVKAYLGYVYYRSGIEYCSQHI